MCRNGKQLGGNLLRGRTRERLWSDLRYSGTQIEFDKDLFMGRFACLYRSPGEWAVDCCFQGLD